MLLNSPGLAGKSNCPFPSQLLFFIGYFLKATQVRSFLHCCVLGQLENDFLGISGHQPSHSPLHSDHVVRHSVFDEQHLLHQLRAASCQLDLSLPQRPSRMGHPAQACSRCSKGRQANSTAETRRKATRREAKSGDHEEKEQEQERRLREKKMELYGSKIKIKKVWK